jgi:hypothetical protein
LHPSTTPGPTGCAPKDWQQRAPDQQKQIMNRR